MKYKEINETNCNPTLSYLYRERDKISERIDKLTVLGKDTIPAEEQYEQCCSIISELCNWRRDHDCALEGDDNCGAPVPLLSLYSY